MNATTATDAQDDQRQAERPRLGIEVDHAVEQRQDRDRDQAEAEKVEPAAFAIDRPAAGRADRQVAARHRHRDQAERRDHEEDRAPAPPLDQHAADARADRRGEDDAEAEDAHRLAALALAEGVQDDDRRNRLQHARGQALGDAHRQDDLEARAEAADHAADHEQRDRADVGVAVAVAVEQPGRGQHRQRHRPHEAGREPLGALLAEGEDVRHVRHGDVDDGRGHDRRHRADHHRRQHPPAVRRAEAALERGAGMDGIGIGRVHEARRIDPVDCRRAPPARRGGPAVRAPRRAAGSGTRRTRPGCSSR